MATKMVETARKPLENPMSERLERPPLNEVGEPCRSILRHIDEAKKNLQPTPVYGEIVGWCESVQRRADGEYLWSPAIVLEVLDPGRVTLKVFQMSGMDRIAYSVLYIQHPSQLLDANVRVGPGGGWFYRESLGDPNWQPSKSAFLPHARALDRREQLCLRDEQRRIEVEIEQLRHRKEGAVKTSQESDGNSR